MKDIMKKEVKLVKEMVIKLKDIDARLKLTNDVEEITKLKGERKKAHDKVKEQGFTYEDATYFYTVRGLLYNGSLNLVTIKDVTFDVAKTVLLLNQLGVKKIRLENHSSECLEYVFELSKYYDITDRYYVSSDRKAVEFTIKENIV